MRTRNGNRAAAPQPAAVPGEHRARRRADRGDQGSHALDLDDLHLSAFFERLPFDVHARGPILAANPDQPVDLVHTA